MTGSPIAAEAAALLARHGALLKGDDCGHVYVDDWCERCGYHCCDCEETVCSGVDGDIGEWRDDSAATAIDAARVRLQGRDRPEPDQLALDLRGRGRAQ